MKCHADRSFGEFVHSVSTSKIANSRYLRGEDNVLWLQSMGNTFWNKDARKDDTAFVGYNYGLLTHWPTKDGQAKNQLKEVIQELRGGSCSRNLNISLYSPAEEVTLASCITFLQFLARPSADGKCQMLDLIVTQRSSDFALGLPNDVFQFGTLVHLVCRFASSEGVQYRPGKMHWHFGHVHIYGNHVEKMRDLLGRESPEGKEPRLIIKDSAPASDAGIYGVKPRTPLDVGHFEVQDYRPGKPMKFELNGRDNANRQDGDNATKQGPCEDRSGRVV